LDTIKAIDITTGNHLFRQADPVGLLPTPSACDYVGRLKKRIHERFPDADVYVRWSPSKTDAVDIFTMPGSAEAEAEIAELAQDLRTTSDAWLHYDEGVRDAFRS
jgi:hypothetical protein